MNLPAARRAHALLLLLTIGAALQGCRADPPAEPTTLPVGDIAGFEANADDIPMSRYLEGAWRFDLEGTLKQNHRGLASALMKPWDFEDRFGRAALAYKDGTLRAIRLADGLHRVPIEVTLTDRAFGDAWLKLSGEPATAIVSRSGDDGVIMNDDEFATRWVRTTDLKVDWDDPGDDDNTTGAGPQITFCGQTYWRDDDAVECTGHPEVTDLSPLRALPWLRYLDLTDSGVSDLSGLGTPARLVDVDLRGTKVRDLTPLRGARFLNDLDLGRTAVRDLTPLHGARWLYLVKLDGTPATQTSIDALQAAFTARERDRDLIISGCERGGPTPCDRSDDLP